MQPFLARAGEHNHYPPDKLQQQLVQCSQLLRNIPISEKYHYQSPGLINFYQHLDYQELDCFHRQLLIHLIKGFSTEQLKLSIPPSMKLIYTSEFLRIKQRVNQAKGFCFDWNNDQFVKDLAICSGRLLPIGPGLLEVSGIPRRILFAKGIRQLITTALCCFKMGAFSPFFSNHTHLANVSQFNQQGWHQAYMVVADLLKANPQFLGFMRSSWFIDPEISQISPHLSYLREVPQDNGALILYYGDQEQNSGAFSRSKSRLALYKQGKYTPREYYAVWPRQALIDYCLSAKTSGASTVFTK